MSKKPTKDLGGRPTVMTDEVLQKLEYAFKIGATDIEACGYANISERTLYNYQTENPEFLQKKAIWKSRQVLKAKHNIATALEEGDVNTSKWLLERKGDGYDTKTSIKHEGEINTSDNEKLFKLLQDFVLGEAKDVEEVGE